MNTNEFLSNWLKHLLVQQNMILNCDCNRDCGYAVIIVIAENCGKIRLMWLQCCYDLRPHAIANHNLKSSNKAKAPTFFEPIDK